MIPDETVKLTLTELRSGKVQARIDQSPNGASKWPAHEFEWPNRKGQWFRSFMDSWQKRRPPKKPTGEEFGRKLYDLVFDTNIRSRFEPLIEETRAKGGNLRLALNLTGSGLSRIPFELLHDGHGFLMFGGARIVRIFDEWSASSRSFAPFRRLLFVLAQPNDQDEWGHDEYLAALTAAIKDVGGIDLVTLPHATRDRLMAELRELQDGKRRFDAVHIIAHGKASASDATILLEDEHGGSAPLPANVLAQALKDHLGCFVYLNSCSTTLALGNNPFAGYAQRLMRDGACGSVFAMQKPISIDQARSVAETFFAELSRGKTAEASAHKAVTTTWTDATNWGIPCLYTQLSLPDQERRDRIAAFFSAEPGSSTFSFYLPAFRLGLSEDDYRRLADAGKLQVPEKVFNYKGPTHARSDTLAAAGLIALVGEMLPPGRAGVAVQILRASEFDENRASHIFLFGSKSHEKVQAVLDNYSKDFRFSYKDPTTNSDEFWEITDLKENKSYKVPDPSKWAPGSAERSAAAERDYAVIEKIIDEENDRVFFVLAGLQDRGTRGAGEHLAAHWEELITDYGASPFQVLLEFGPGLGSLGAKVIARKTKP